MLNTSFPPWPSFSEEEAAAVSRVLLSNRVNYWTGTEGREFEREFAEWCGVPHAVALSNGTLALELAFRALGIGPGDQVVLTPRTFVASASSVVAVGAEPVFADVDADSQNITADSVRQVLTPRSKAILCVHLAGWPCDMESIASLAKEHALHVIEDCAQAHGARYRGQPVGSFGAAAAWSFCQDKIMTTGGEGGMLTTSRQDVWQTSWAYKDHGKSYDAVYNRTHPKGFRWVHDSFGSNWRMLEMQAVLGRLQLRKMDDWHARRSAHARALLDAFGRVPGLRTPLPPAHVDHAWYRVYSFVEPSTLAEGWTRDRIVEEVFELGVPCFQGSCSEIYLERAFEGTPFRPTRRLPVAKQLGETSLAFLVHPTLGESELEKTISAVSQVMRRAVR